MTWIGRLGAAVLCGFTARRLLMLAASLCPPRQLHGASGRLPSVAILVPARNEAGTIDSTLKALAELDYPEELVFTMLIDDGSEDRTAVSMSEWAEGRRAAVVELPRKRGKTMALNRAIELAPASDLVMVVDADLSPRHDCLRRLVDALGDPSVGAAAGLITPVNATSTPIARYAAVESWVHQLVTSAGKDRLGLDPPILGCSVYRHRALDAVGRFPSGESGEDLGVAAALAGAGWRIRFVPQAVAGSVVVERWEDYWRQHLRWASDLFGLAAGGRQCRSTAGLRRRIDWWLVSAGYGDRVVVIGVLLLAARSRVLRLAVGVYLSVAAAQVAVAVSKARGPRAVPSFLLWTAVLFGVDIAASLQAAAHYVIGSPPVWDRRRDSRPLSMGGG